MVLNSMLAFFLFAMSASVFAQVSAEAETAAAIARIEKLNPLLNAVIAVDPEALEQARTLDRARTERGPLFGIPIVIKDNIETKGKLPTTAGSLALKDNVTGHDAPVVERLRSAGAPLSWGKPTFPNGRIFARAFGFQVGVPWVARRAIHMSLIVPPAVLRPVRRRPLHPEL